MFAKCINTALKASGFGATNRRNLATSQAVFTKLDNAIKLAQERNLHTVPTLYDAAQLVGECLRETTSSMPKPSHKKRIPSLEEVLFWVDKSKDNPPKFILSTLKAIASEQRPIRLFPVR